MRGSSGKVGRSVAGWLRLAFQPIPHLNSWWNSAFAVAAVVAPQALTWWRGADSSTHWLILLGTVVLMFAVAGIRLQWRSDRRNDESLTLTANIDMIVRSTSVVEDDHAVPYMFLVWIAVRNDGRPGRFIAHIPPPVVGLPTPSPYGVDVLPWENGTDDSVEIARGQRRRLALAVVRMPTFQFRFQIPKGEGLGFDGSIVKNRVEFDLAIAATDDNRAPHVERVVIEFDPSRWSPLVTLAHGDTVVAPERPIAA